jgi:hypothetical protein
MKMATDCESKFIAYGGADYSVAGSTVSPLSGYTYIICTHDARTYYTIFSNKQEFHTPNLINFTPHTPEKTMVLDGNFMRPEARKFAPSGKKFCVKWERNLRQVRRKFASSEKFFCVKREIFLRQAGKIFASSREENRAKREIYIYQ